MLSTNLALIYNRLEEAAVKETQNFFSLTKQEIFDRFTTNDEGLSKQEAATRLQKYGQNKLSEKKEISSFEIFIDQFKNLLVIILLASAALTFIVYIFGEKDRDDLIEGGLILAIVIMIAVLGFIQEYRAEKAIEALKKLLAFKAKVIREGREKEIDTVDLVPGDLVVLEEGEKVPADIRVIDVASLQTNEASLTGESTPVNKITEVLSGDLQIADQKNMVFSSTVITSGRGLGVVVSTGDSTQIGKIARVVAETEEEETPIQKRLDKLGRILGYGTLAISTVVFVFIVFFAQDFSHLSLLDKLLKSFIASVALAVAAIPEGLPAVVTISLAFGTQRMLKRNALVRKLTSVETLGSVDVICADKTGTLTSGEMTVREIYFDGTVYSVTGHGYEPVGDFQLEGKNIDPKNLNLILKAGSSCNNAHLDESGKILGDPTEGALIVDAYKGGFKETGKRIYEVPFNSERKMMSVVVEENKDLSVYTKGAPEIVLTQCTKLIKNGSEVVLNEEDKKQILAENAKMAAKALRVLGFAYKKIDKLDKESIEKDLIFIGLQAMMDPPRENIGELISKATKSGIDVVMITGDHLATAQAIAGEIGIVGESIAGNELEKMSDEEFSKKVEAIKIYARVNPEHKFRIVDALKKRGHLVAMTGDGVNDAPALKKADIGVAMGITGTDVAKEASDMVLLDDQFNTIIAAIEEGRGIFDNIRKFVNYLLSCNVGEVLVVFLALLIFKDVILTAVMLLWINIVTDGIPAVALGLDPAEKGIIQHSPKKFQEQIINKRVWFEVIFFGIALTISTLLIFYLNLPESLDEARAAAFIAIVIFELVRLVNIRSDYKIPWRDNLLLPLSIIAAVALQLVIVYVPVFSNWFELSPIDAFDWIYIAIVTAILYIAFRFFDNFLDRFTAFTNIKSG
ncbi:MAG: calcium-translocating P-type ATPase, PMCA-type [Candidatus Woykebacteria bacterium RIFCSPHIGHO2_01_FULL_39_12]|uniref:P-type Ca(2+) transporter n=1 Tax=Candidatus Woykebacteria bacterium RIFCSPHIGHO2_01_FULL_39_12 TaxID=1802599 RepID=A0A1G1WHU6_9BACT|nr:MAG: calcium-translocating P-type ATPase, PMCA-type [Candidatus Woykebacteria bacterium RIFCSPHIGHO2_01_FULL_39_12]